MKVVTDASPLNYLVLINAEHVLPRLFDEVLVPAAVIEELTHVRTPTGEKGDSHLFPVRAADFYDAQHHGASDYFTHGS